MTINILVDICQVLGNKGERVLVAFLDVRHSLVITCSGNWLSLVHLLQNEYRFRVRVIIWVYAIWLIENLSEIWITEVQHQLWQVLHLVAWSWRWTLCQNLVSTPQLFKFIRVLLNCTHKVLMHHKSTVRLHFHYQKVWQLFSSTIDFSVYIMWENSEKCQLLFSEAQINTFKWQILSDQQSKTQKCWVYYHGKLGKLAIFTFEKLVPVNSGYFCLKNYLTNVSKLLPISFMSTMNWS